MTLHTIRTAFTLVVMFAGTAFTQAPAPVPSLLAGPYEPVAITAPDVQAAVKVAMADQQKKNGSDLKLLSIFSAERQPVSGRNMRLCLSTDRSGNTEFARVELSRNTKKRWSVTLWSWGSCGR